MKKEPEPLKKPDPYISAYYFQDELKVFEVISEEASIIRGEPSHLHDEIEMLYIVDGSGFLNVNGVDFPVSVGDMAWLFPFHVHALRPAPKQNLTVYICRYSLGVLTYLKINRQSTSLSLSILEYTPPLLALTAPEQARAKALFEEILLENEQRELNYELILFSCLLRLVAIFERKASSYIEKKQKAVRPMAWNALQYLQFHFNQEIDSAIVASKFNLSVSELNGALRLLTGKNFSKNLNDTRIRNACAMMQFNELSIPYISRAVGYSSPAIFYRQFKAIKSMTPDQYRGSSKKNTGDKQVIISDSAHVIFNYINDNYRNPITAETAAEALFMSEATVSNAVKKNFNSTFSQILLFYRLQVSAGLLLSTQMPVYDIAISTGFNSIRTFSRCFAQEFGTNPTAFRKSRSQEEDKKDL